MDCTTDHDTTQTDTPRRRIHVMPRIFLWLLLISCVLYLLSSTFRFVRLMHLMTLAWGLLTAGRYLVLLLRTSRVARLPVLLLAMGLASWVHFADRPPDIASLRAAYVARLRSFERTRYIWGGESHAGIDCSGLARIALCEAMIVRGICEMNPRLLGPQLWAFWWHDVSASMMRDGAYAYTMPRGHALALASYTDAGLLPGDLAVTDSGVHVLISLGQDRWIEANPDDHRVVINAASASPQRAYFQVPVTIMRWTMLAQ